MIFVSITNTDNRRQNILALAVFELYPVFQDVATINEEWLHVFNIELGLKS